MKKFKKLAALMLAVVMALAMSITAFAAEADGYKIVITNSSDGLSMQGKTYTAYKLFDVSMNVGNKAYVYTVSDAFKNFTHMGYTGKDLVDYVGTLTSDSEALNAFAKAAYEHSQKQSNVIFKTATATEASSVTIDLDEAGYYIVYGEGETENGKTVVAAISLTTTNPEGAITLKADVPSIDKVIVEDTGDTKGTAKDVGSIVKFKLTSKVPDMTGYEKYTFIVHDTMSSGLDFNKSSVKVEIGEDENTDYTIEEDGQSFKIVFTPEEFVKLETGKEIVITYNATLNSNALKSDEENNTVKLEYSNSPYGDGTGETPEKKVYVYDFDITIDKFEKDKDTVKLAGAKFILKNENNKYYHVDDQTKAVTWVDEKDATVVTTDDNGAAGFTGLSSGEYQLIETEAPAGYNKLQDPVEIKITITYNEDGTIESKNADVDNGQLSVTQKVPNATGSLLPSTGGIGTTIFYVIGAILVIGAGVILVAKKRMSNE